MHPKDRYVGIDKDIRGGMTDIGKIIRDAWVFGLIPETETCEGWRPEAIEGLWEQVNAQWRRYDFRVATLPDDLRARFAAIHGAAVEQARASGWTGAQELAADS
jgi:hypothetical protein